MYSHPLEAAAEARVRDFCADLDASLNPGTPTTRELTALNKLYGERITEARSLAGMPRYVLAQRLGLSLAQVAQIENGRAGELPAWLLARVATITCCRLDFLAGLSEESECDESSTLYEIIAAQMLHADTECALRTLAEVGQRQTSTGAPC